MVEFGRELRTILDTETYPTTNTTPELQQRFLNRFSFGALVFNFAYFFAMRDRLLAWLSLFVTIVFIFSPLLLVFPFWARRRAYQSRPWQSFGQFEHIQKKWDRAGVWALVVVILLFYLLFRLLTPLLLNGFQQINPELLNGNSDNYVQQLQQTENDLQQILGQ